MILASCHLHLAAAQVDAKDLILRARAAAHQNDLQTADALLERAQKDEPGEALMLRGNIAAFMRRDAEAGIKFYHQAIAADPGKWDVHYFLGRVYAGQKRWAEAVDAAMEAVRLAPTNGAALLDLGQAHASNGSWEQAATALQRAAAVDVHNVQPLLTLANTASAFGHMSAALLAYKDASELHPWHAHPMVQLASLLTKLKAGDAAAVEAAATALAMPGAASVCDLRDAAVALHPSIAIPPEVAEACPAVSAAGASSKLQGSKVAPAITDPSELARLARSVEGTGCDMLAPYPELAAFAILDGTAEKVPGRPALLANETVSPPPPSPPCVVRVPRSMRLRLAGPKAQVGSPSSGIVITSGTSLTIEGARTAATDDDTGEDERQRPALDCAGGAQRHLLVAAGGSLHLRGVTLRGGRSLMSGGGAVLVLPGGSLSAERTTFEHNRAVLGSGGAIAARGGSLRLSDVRFVGNAATLRGGALSLTAYSKEAAATASDGSAAAEARAEVSGRLEWDGNRAGRAGNDVMLCAGANLSPRPSSSDAAIDECASGSAQSMAGKVAVEGGMIEVSDGTLTGIECASEALELLEIRGLEAEGNRLLHIASLSDPFSPSIFSFQFNFLYGHGHDALAATRLSAFEKARPEHSSIKSHHATLANQSAPFLHQRGKSINGHVTLMRKGIPVAIRQSSRLEAQDAASTAFAQALALTQTDGNIWSDYATSLWFAGELAEAALVSAEGYKHAPTHSELAKEHARAKAFPLAPESADEITHSLFGGRSKLAGGGSTAAEGATFASEFTTITLPRGSYGDQRSSMDLQAGVETFGLEPNIYVSSRSLLPKETCTRYIAAAEAWATKSGGWTTSRHYSVATTDIPLVSLPELLPSWNDALHTLLLPALSACYPEAAPLASKLVVLDCFLVRYDAQKQSSLPTHTDQSLLSFTIALNDPSEYDGGGTWFRGLGRAVDAPAAGHAVLFPGKIEHGGHPISKGVRYIIVLFMGYRANRMSGRDAGYALRSIRGGEATAAASKDEL